MTQIPRYHIYNIYAGFDYSLTIKDFWVYCGEQGIKSLNLSFFYELIPNSENLELPKLFTKLQKLEEKNKFIRAKLPKYIVRMSMSLRKAALVGGSEEHLITFFDNIYGAEQVKMVPASPAITSIEVWLKDDDDLATLEFYQASNPELFFTDY